MKIKGTMNWMVLYFLLNIKRQRVVWTPASINGCLSKIKNWPKDTHRSLISRDRIDWKVKLAIRLNDHVMWGKPNKENVNEMHYGGWNEWDGPWTEGNKNETWSMKCRLKEMRWNMNTVLFEFNDFTSRLKKC